MFLVIIIYIYYKEKFPLAASLLCVPDSVLPLSL